MQPSPAETWKTLLLFVLLCFVGAALGWVLIPAPSGEGPARRKSPEPMVTGGGGRVEQVGEAMFDQHVATSPLPILVEFYADWCAPCLELAPVLEELARETPGVKFLKVNMDLEPALAARYNVTAIPRLLVLKGGHIVADHTGSTSKSRVKALLGL